MSDSDSSSRDDRVEGESDDTLTPVHSIVSGEVPQDRESLQRMGPWTHVKPGEPWVDWDKLRPPPEYEQAMKRMTLGDQVWGTPETKTAKSVGQEEGTYTLSESMVTHGTPDTSVLPPPPGMGFPVPPSFPKGVLGEDPLYTGSTTVSHLGEDTMVAGKTGGEKEAPWLLTEQVLDEWVESLAPTREASPVGEGEPHLARTLSGVDRAGEEEELYAPASLTVAVPEGKPLTKSFELGGMESAPREGLDSASWGLATVEGEDPERLGKDSLLSLAQFNSGKGFTRALEVFKEPTFTVAQGRSRSREVYEDSMGARP
jgi:hypothetical protein